MAKKTCRKCGEKFLKWERYRIHMLEHGLNPYDELLRSHGEPLVRPKHIKEKMFRTERKIYKKRVSKASPSR